MGVSFLSWLLIVTIFPSSAYPYEFSRPLMWFSLIVLLSSLVGTIGAILKGLPLYFPGKDATGIFVYSLFTATIISACKSGFNLWTFYFVSMSAGSVLILNLVKNNILTFKHISVSLSIIFFIYLAIVFLQWCGLVPAKSNSFTVTGTFSNPNIAAMHIVCCFPFAIQIVSKWSNGKFAFALLCITTYLILYLLQTRTAIIGMAGILTYSVFRLHLRSLTSYIGLFSIVAGSILLVAVLNSNKSRSTQSRALIWKQTASIIMENPVAGVGLGNFTKHINQKLSSYFTLNSEAKEKDNFTLPLNIGYNDYLQLSAESGIAGICIMLSLVAFLFGRQPMSPKQITLQSSVVGVLTMCLTNSVIYAVPIGLTLAVILPFSEHSKATATIGTSGWQVTYKLCMIALISVAFLYTLKLNNALYSLKRSELLTTEGLYDRALALLKPLRPVIENDGLYWKNIGRAFYGKENIRLAKSAYLKAAGIWYDAGSFAMLSQLERRSGNIEPAIDNMRKAASITPGYLPYKFELFNLYRSIKDTANTVYYATQVSNYSGSSNKKAETFKEITNNYLNKLSIYTQ